MCSWFLTGDARVAITDGNACLTVPGADDDEFTMTGKVYTMRCEDNNDYQGEAACGRQDEIRADISLGDRRALNRSSA
jgi:hypothetical protein